MIDQLVHHADVVSPKGDSYRLKDRDLGRVHGGHHRRAMTTEGLVSPVATGSVFGFWPTFRDRTDPSLVTAVVIIAGM